jgi:hypothetical protein
VGHRELVQTRSRASRFRFLELPEELQDRIIGALDARKMTFLEAERVAREVGFPISDGAIWAYYRALREERYKEHLIKPFLSGIEKLGDKEKIGRLTQLCLMLILRLHDLGALDIEDPEGLGLTTAVAREFFGKHWKGSRRKLRSYLRR